MKLGGWIQVSKVKFSGWRMLILVSLIVALDASSDLGFLSISNTVMFSGQQIAITATTFGLAFSVYAFLQGPTQPIVAQIVKKIGSRNTLIIGSLLSIVLGLGVSNFITSGTSFVAIYGVVYGLSNVISQQLAAQTLINNWFHQRRGQALAIHRAIGAFFGIFAPYVATYVITQYGGSFRIGWYLAGANSVITLIMCFFLKNSPKDVGQTVDGSVFGDTINIKENPKGISTVYKRPIGLPKITLKEARKMPIFWAVVISSALGFVLVMAINASFNVYFTAVGFSLESISIASAVRSIVAVVLLIIMSTLLDKVEPAFVYGVAFIAYAASCYLSAAMPSSGVWVIYTAYALQAFLSACVVTITPAILANLFGTESFITLQGFTLLVGGLLSSTSGVIVGALADLTGGFSFGLIVYGTIGLIAAVIITLGVGIPCTRKYKRESTSHTKI